MKGAFSLNNPLVGTARPPENPPPKKKAGFLLRIDSCELIRANRLYSRWRIGVQLSFRSLSCNDVGADSNCHVTGSFYIAIIIFLGNNFCITLLGWHLVCEAREVGGLPSGISG